MHSCMHTSSNGGNLPRNPQAYVTRRCAGTTLVLLSPSVATLLLLPCRTVRIVKCQTTKSVKLVDVRATSPYANHAVYHAFHLAKVSTAVVITPLQQGPFNPPVNLTREHAWSVVQGLQHLRGCHQQGSRPGERQLPRVIACLPFPAGKVSVVTCSVSCR